MINHEEKAHELFKQGYNCAQSVFAAFCDVTGIDFETAIKPAWEACGTPAVRSPECSW